MTFVLPNIPRNIRRKHTHADTANVKRSVRKKQPSNRGFTLIELLVVIAIISVLISVLLPSLSKAKYLAKKVICASQLRSFGTALTQYASENDGYLPTWNWRDDPISIAEVHFMIVNDLVEDDPTGKTERLFPEYISSPEMFYCPQVQEWNQDWPETRWSPGYGGWDTWSSYAYFGGGNRVATYFGSHPEYSPIKLQEGQKPVMQDVWYETGHGDHWISHADKGDTGFNVLYVAGHVEWTLEEDLNAHWWRYRWAIK